MNKIFNLTLCTAFTLLMIYVAFRSDTTGGQWMSIVLALVGVSKVLDHYKQ